jgi:hypothetical protein
MLMLRTGSLRLWCNLWIMVAAAVAPFGRWNAAVDTVPVGSVRADGSNTLEVAAVSLTTEGMELLRTPWQTSTGVELTCLMMSLLLRCLCCWYAVFVGVASGEIEMHMLIPLTGKEERFERTWGWIKRFNLASKQGPIVA